MSVFLLLPLFLSAVRELAAELEAAVEDVAATYQIKGQIIFPESFTTQNGKPSPSRVLVNYDFKYIAFVRLVIIK